MKPSLIVIGLGNPGASYARTRHNIGFRALEHLGEAYGAGEWQEKQKFVCRAREARIVTVPVLLVEPQTYMNNSGDCVRKLLDYYKLDASKQILVICDDIDLPLGELRLRLKGGPGTHNGLRSIVACVGENFPRLRIGLGEHPTGEALAGWVLSVPPPEQEKVLQNAYAALPHRLKDFVMEAVKEE